MNVDYEKMIKQGFKGYTNVDFEKMAEQGLMIYYEDMNPEDFVKFKMASPHETERTEIIPPKLGKREYGKIRVHFRTPKPLYIQAYAAAEEIDSEPER